VRTGLRREGSITANSLRVLTNTGPYGTHALTVTGNTGTKPLPLYRTSNMKFQADIVYTNLPIAGAFRGYGAPQGFFAMEVQMDQAAEALGMSLPGTAAIPAVHADRLRAGEATGALAAELARKPRRPSEIITQKSVENALRVLLALGGSTNAVIHLTAIAGRAGIKISLDHLNTLSDSTPVLVNLKPVGNGYMEDFCAAGGMGALLRELKPLLHPALIHI